MKGDAASQFHLEAVRTKAGNLTDDSDEIAKQVAETQGHVMNPPQPLRERMERGTKNKTTAPWEGNINEWPTAPAEVLNIPKLDVPKDHDIMHNLDMKEFNRFLATRKRNTAPGPDHILTETLQALPEAARECILELFINIFSS